MPDLYDAFTEPPGSLEDAKAAVGRKATLHLTGTITEAKVSQAGAFVRFKVDGRWGFGELVLGCDLAALELEP